VGSGIIGTAPGARRPRAAAKSLPFRRYSGKGAGLAAYFVASSITRAHSLDGRRRGIAFPGVVPMVKFTRAIAMFGVAASALALSAPAHATWRVAETEHFIYYSEASPDELVAAVTRMEKFDKLVRGLTNNTRPSSPLKVTMFEVGTMADVNATFPYPMEGVGGYYNSTTEGPFLVTFRDSISAGMRSAKKASRQSYAWGPEVRQHEYLHHYMYQYFNANYPSWYSEGFAEYYGTMAFPEANVAEIGHAPFFRIDTIRGGSWVSAKELLTAKSYADVSDLGALYAEGWLLTHLAAQDPEKGKQLKQYLDAVATGTDYEKAATDAFGDLDVLNSDLKKHLKNIEAMRLSLKPMDFGKIAVRELSPLDSELMRYKIRLYSGFEMSDLPQIISTVRKLRASNPDDPMGLEIQAQLENLAGQHAEALKDANRLLAVKPDSVEGLTEKGKAMTGLLKPGASAGEWEAAREPLRAAIAASKTATEPRVALFQSFQDQGQLPSVEAQNHLVEAFDLLPQNDTIRYLLAQDFENRDMIDDAIKVIEPAAFGTFDGDEKEKRKRERQLNQAAKKYTGIDDSESPRDMLDRLEAKRDGRWNEATKTFTPKPEDADAKHGDKDK
jgi:tetratricopeptide (TPR) repeat protein